MIFYNIEAVLIIILGIYIAVKSIIYYRKHKFWFDIFLIFVGVLWVGLFVFILYSSPLESAWIGQTFARPLIWTTLIITISLRELLNINQRGKNGH